MGRASIAILLVGAAMLSSILSVAFAETGTLGVYKLRKPSPIKQSVPVYSGCSDGSWNSSASLKSDEAIFTGGNGSNCGWTYIVCRHSNANECLDTKIPRKLVKVVATCAGCSDTFLVSQETFNQVAGAGASPGFAIDYSRIILN